MGTSCWVEEEEKGGERRGWRHASYMQERQGLATQRSGYLGCPWNWGTNSHAGPRASALDPLYEILDWVFL